MKLHTYQNFDIREKFNGDGWYYPQREGISINFIDQLDEDYWLKAYDWMRMQMHARIPNFSGSYPIWAYFSHRENKSARGAFRRSVRWSRKNGQERSLFLVCFNVPKYRCLVSDFDAWHCILNSSSIENDKVDCYDAYLKTHPELNYPHLDTFNSLTWHRVFDVHPEQLQKNWGRKKHITKDDLQICVDGIHESEIVSVKQLV